MKGLKLLGALMNKLNCNVYVATKMTGRDKAEMVQRAYYVCDVLRHWGLTPISPVIEEEVPKNEGLLLQSSNEQLKKFWKRDKDIIVYQAHVVLCDEADNKSLGMEREYGFSRYCLWKPTLTILPKGINVACFEDDIVVQTVDAAASIIAQNWGTCKKRWVWRIKMLVRTLPRWFWRQIIAWR